jgi:seryl-tRNA synthetase
MHDIKAIRENTAAFVAALARRPAYASNAQAVADDLLARDKELRDLLTRLQAAQARRNEASKLIGKAKAQKDEAQAQALMAEVAGLKDEIQTARYANASCRRQCALRSPSSRTCLHRTFPSARTRTPMCPSRNGPSARSRR